MRDERDVGRVGGGPDGQARPDHGQRPPHRPGRPGDRDQDGQLHQVEHRVEQAQGAQRVGEVGGGDVAEHHHPADRDQGQPDDHPVEQGAGLPDQAARGGQRAEQRGGAGDDAGGEEAADQRGVRQLPPAEPFHRPQDAAERGERHGDREQRPEPAQRHRVPAGHPDAGDRRPGRDRHRAQVADQGRAGQPGHQPAGFPEYDDRGRDETDAAGQRGTGHDGAAHVLRQHNDSLRLSLRRTLDDEDRLRAANGASVVTARCRRQSRPAPVTVPGQDGDGLSSCR